MEDHPIYLFEPIIIDGTKIGLTPSGLEAMIEHYQYIIDHHSSKMDDSARQHCQSVIEKYKIHLAIYERKGLHPQQEKRK